MSEILTIHGGMVQGQDHVNDGESWVCVLDTDGDEGVVSLDIQSDAKDHEDKSLDEVAREIVHSYNLAYDEDCEHTDSEDHIFCISCGQCREDLDSEDRCIPCGGTDENEDNEEEKCDRCGKVDDNSETYYIANNPEELLCKSCAVQP